jgi:hypothetical protein
MFVVVDAAVIGVTMLEKIDWLLNRTDQRLVPNPAHPDQPLSEVNRCVMLSGRDSGPLALGRKGKQPCRYTNIIV